MAVFELPTSTTAPSYNFEVELDGVVFRLRFLFNSRSEFWYMNIENEDGTILRAGIKIVNEFSLLLRWVDVLARPAGDMIAIPLGENKTPAGLEDLGERVILAYVGES